MRFCVTMHALFEYRVCIQSYTVENVGGGQDPATGGDPSWVVSTSI